MAVGRALRKDTTPVRPNKNSIEAALLMAGFFCARTLKPARPPFKGCRRGRCVTGGTGAGLVYRRFAVAFLLVHSSFAAVGRVLPSWFLIALQKLRGRSGAGSRLGLGWFRAFRAGSRSVQGWFLVGSRLVRGWFPAAFLLTDSRFAFALRASPSPNPKEKAMTFTTYVGVARGEPPPRTSTRQAVNPLRTHED